ncbi:hypothetical protein [Krasilnikovia sp. M28-CT-15]|uniref:hypothetical protein n=1 Tax=Krasilnikovia sp. M28-CT-15 TaxID=3373540 RepID=UPI003876258C
MNSTVELRPVEIPEWDELDLEQAQLGPVPEEAGATEIETMLGEIAFRLPVALPQESLESARSKETPLLVPLEASEGHDYFLLAVPLTIIVPERYALTRLRLKLRFHSDAHDADVVAQDLAPTTQTVERAHDVGEVSLDVSKALSFVLPPAVAECFGLRLAFPLRWKSEYALIQASGFMSNPVEWYVADEAMRNGFIGYVITRSAPGTAFDVAAEVAAEVRHVVLGRIRRARFLSDKRNYTVVAK